MNYQPITTVKLLSEDRALSNHENIFNILIIFIYIRYDYQQWTKAL